MKQSVCYGCTERAPYCHGKNEDGSWRCEKWGIKQDQREAAYQEKRREIRGAIDASTARFICFQKIEKRKRNHGY